MLLANAFYLSVTVVVVATTCENQGNLEGYESFRNQIKITKNLCPPTALVLSLRCREEFVSCFLFLTRSTRIKKKSKTPVGMPVL